MELADVTGKILLRKTGITTVGENRIIVDMSKFALGIYFINLTDSENGRRGLKLNKE